MMPLFLKTEMTEEAESEKNHDSKLKVAAASSSSDCKCLHFRLCVKAAAANEMNHVCF